MEEMTGDAYVVTRILLSMTPKQRAAVMAEMDPVYAAKLIQQLCFHRKGKMFESFGFCLKK